jgi:hypothetical protein
MLTTDTLTARRAALAAEREQQELRFIVADRQAEAQIAQMETQLAEARAARAKRRTSWEQHNHAYAAVLGELERLLAQCRPGQSAEDGPDPAVVARI